MEINKSNVLEITKTLNIKPSKDYGQNFLIEPEIASRIVNSLELNDDDSVLEIGPGLGSLSHYIIEQSHNTTLVDIDERICEFLKIIYKDYPALNIVNSDIRKFNVDKYSKIISNLPYNITTEIISKLLTESINCSTMVLMCQSENFAHFNDVCGKEYGPYSVAIHLIGKITRILTVKPGSFYPAPQCNSVVFRIDIKSGVDRNVVNSVFSFAKQMFLNRRKTICNNLSIYLNSKDLACKILDLCKISYNTRPEEISPANYLALYQKVIEFRLSKTL